MASSGLLVASSDRRRNQANALAYHELVTLAVLDLSRLVHRALVPPDSRLGEQLQRTCGNAGAAAAAEDWPRGGRSTPRCSIAVHTGEPLF